MVVSMKGGLASFTRRDIDTMVSAGHDVTLLATKVTSAVVGPAGTRVPLTGRVSRGLWALAGVLQLAMSPEGRLFLRYGFGTHEAGSILLACAYYARLARPDLVYAVFGDRKLFVGYFLAILWKCRLTVTVHAYELHTNPSPALFRKALQRCSRVMTVTEFNRECLRDVWGVPDSKIDVVRISVDKELFSAGRKFVILMVGHVSYIKGHAVLFDAVRGLHDSSIEIWVVGSAGGAFPADPVHLARECGVERQVITLGWQSEAAVAALMRRADVLCVPSRQDPDGNLEGFPTVLAEAMHIGLPVITTRHAEIPRVVPAAVVPPNSSKALAAAIVRYRNDTAIREADAKVNQVVADRLFVGDSASRLLGVLEALAKDS